MQWILDPSLIGPPSNASICRGLWNGWVGRFNLEMKELSMKLPATPESVNTEIVERLSVCLSFCMGMEKFWCEIFV